MKNMTIKNIAEACSGEIHGEYNEAAEASCVVIDSRLIEEGGVFIATKGERVDGHSFIGQVFEKGALAVVCEELPENPAGPCILVDNSLLALKYIAAFYREQLDCHVIGITGSVGKTSTKEMVASVLSQGKKVCATEGNHNNEVGVPLTILRIRDDDECAVVEMGINHFEEMTRLSHIARPDTVLITNIGECHLENLGDRDGVLKAKSEIFEYFTGKGGIILNGMDDELNTITEVKGIKPIRFGFSGMTEGRAPDYRADNVQDCGLYGSNVTIKGPKAFRINVHIPLSGDHMILNATAAAAVGKLLGLKSKQIKTGIESVKATGGRSNIIKSGKLTIIDDCYNANPTSVRAAIDLLCKAEGRKMAVLGDMYELGGHENKLHADIGAYAKERGVDVLICAGPLCKSMAEAFDGALWYKDTDEVCRMIRRQVRAGDTILIKASHGMHYEKVVESIT